MGREAPSEAVASTAEEAGRLKSLIRAQGLAVGFDKVGFAPALLPSEAPQLESWLRRNYHGEMHWMGREPARRTDAGRILSGTQTVICCALSYYQGPPRPVGPTTGVISSYARGEDYHRVLQARLRRLARFVEELCRVRTKTYVDTGPLLEKAYAVAAGLGWQGKHSNLIARRGSSWFFLGEILLPLALPPDRAKTNHCGSCARCITACPTRAIVEPYVVDSRRCISYLTIELRGFIPHELRSAVGNRIYGCDDCQDVCPWNRFAKKSNESRFLPREPLASMDLIAMLQMGREEFLSATRASAIRRARYAGFLRNVAVALGNSGDPRAIETLTQALDHDEPLVRGHVACALARLGGAGTKVPLETRLRIEDRPEVRREIHWALDELREAE